MNKYFSKGEIPKGQEDIDGMFYLIHLYYIYAWKSLLIRVLPSKKQPCVC